MLVGKRRHTFVAGSPNGGDLTQGGDVMSTTETPRAGPDGYAATGTRDHADETSGDGWVTFAGAMLVMVGALNIIDGIAAISNSTFLIENARYVVSNLNTFGWIVLILGSVQVLAAFGLWDKTPGVRWFGVTVALLNAIAQMVFISAYPFRSLAVLTIDILVIYGLIAHGKRSLV